MVFVPVMLCILERLVTFRFVRIIVLIVMGNVLGTSIAVSVDQSIKVINYIIILMI